MTLSNPLLIAAAGCATAILALPASAQDSAAAGTGCMAVPEPVVSLSYGSRYTDESADRSDLDAEANAAVDEALKPVDDFISDLARKANDAARGKDGSAEAAACVVDALDQWARGDALTELDSTNAHLSSPSRVGGFAMAYLQAQRAITVDPDKAGRIESWLNGLAREAARWFTREAPEMASQNNLRAWAGYAGAAVGEVTDDDYLRSWANYSFARVACQADDAGALPHEMSRGPRALHYQVHAVDPLVVGAALIQDDGYAPFEMCDGAIRRAVSFIPAAFDDPSLVEVRAGEPQTYTTGEEELKGWAMAWAVPYLSLFDDPELESFVSDLGSLGNSKLGGSQKLIW